MKAFRSERHPRVVRLLAHVRVQAERKLARGCRHCAQSLLARRIRRVEPEPHPNALSLLSPERSDRVDARSDVVARPRGLGDVHAERNDDRADADVAGGLRGFEVLRRHHDNGGRAAEQALAQREHRACVAVALLHPQRQAVRPPLVPDEHGQAVAERATGTRVHVQVRESGNDHCAVAPKDPVRLESLVRHGGDRAALDIDVRPPRLAASVEDDRALDAEACSVVYHVNVPRPSATARSSTVETVASAQPKREPERIDRPTTRNSGSSAGRM